jgi:uncharacterized protein (DUF779 family)
MSTDQASRVAATEPAVAELERLKAEHGPLELFLSGGCCDGSSPMCFPAGELRRGQADVLLGDVAGCAIYMDAEQDRRWGRPSFVLDVGPGAGSGFSLEGLDELHFVARTNVSAGLTALAGSPVALE